MIRNRPSRNTHLPPKRGFKHLGVWSHRVKAESFIDQGFVRYQFLQPPKCVLQSLLGCCPAALHRRVSQSDIIVHHPRRRGFQRIQQQRVVVPRVSKVFAFREPDQIMQSYPDTQTIPIVDPGRYFESPVNCLSDLRRSTNSRACVKMCLATRISRSKESADFSNLIPVVVAVGDMVASVLAESHSLAVTALYEGPYRPRCCRVLLSNPRTRSRGG